MMAPLPDGPRPCRIETHVGASVVERALEVERLQHRQRELSQVQEQLTSGKRVARASDDPAAAARAELALAAIGRHDADARAVDASRTPRARSATPASSGSRRARRWARPATALTAMPSARAWPSTWPHCGRNCWRSPTAAPAPAASCSPARAALARPSSMRWAA
jgi:hypothetical protein